MTSRLASFPLLQASRRQLSAQAVTASKPSAAAVAISGKSCEPKVSTLDNGLTVVSVDSHCPVATLGVLVKSGSRNESYDNAGVSHALKIAAGLGSKNFTSFSITRNFQQAGSNLHCTQGREHTFYSTQVLENKVDDVIDYLLDAAGNQVFKPWEVIDNLPRLKLELAHLDLATRSVEMLHRAAYRTGLGNSLFSPDYMAGKHKSTTLQSFYNKNFTNNRTALIGIGVDHAKLTKYATMLSLESGQSTADKSKYFGGEQRLDAGGRKAYINLAAEVSGLDNKKDSLAAMLLHRILGSSGGHVKYGHGNGKLQKALGAMSSDASATGAFFVYTDSGLLGATITSTADKAGKAVESVAAALRSLSVSAEDLSAAKKSLLLDKYTRLQCPLHIAEKYGMQALFTKSVLPANSVNEMINAVTLGEVQAVAKKLSSGKWSMSSAGNLVTVPYLDSL